MKVEATFVNLSEGRQGDYDPEDPNDVNYLRFYLRIDGQEVQDGSYCTLVPADTSAEEQARLLQLIVDLFVQALREWHAKSPKHTLERLSYIKPGSKEADFR